MLKKMNFSSSVPRKIPQNLGRYPVFKPSKVCGIAGIGFFVQRQWGNITNAIQVKIIYCSRILCNLIILSLHILNLISLILAARFVLQSVLLPNQNPFHPSAVSLGRAGVIIGNLCRMVVVVVCEYDTVCGRSLLDIQPSMCTNI